MTSRLTPSTILMLVLPPLLWAGNAVVGRMVQGMVPPVMMNFIRWLAAFIVLLPLAGWVLRPAACCGAHGAALPAGPAGHRPVQRDAIPGPEKSTPINVTLVGASMPVWMLADRLAVLQGAGIAAPDAGRRAVHRRRAGRAVARRWRQLLGLRLVAGDLLMIVATIVWSLYSWMLTCPCPATRRKLRPDWSAFLMAQVVFGLAWSGLFAGGEWLVSDARIHWSWPLAAALLYVGIGPAIVALRCWGTGVQRVGPSIAAFFSNLTPLFAALLSSAFLGELPHLYHAVAFLLIVGGIVLSSRR